MELAKRIKGYENASEQVLPARMPVILRLDGNSFSKLTKNMKKPFDPEFEYAMNKAAEAVVDYCSGAVFCYVQSDEISILLINDQTPQTDPFLGNRTQKIASLCAAKASVAFNKALSNQTEAVFDCRAFVVPQEEVVNYFLWRQRDCFKNCISAFAYYNLTDKYGRKTAQKMLDGKNTNERQELIFQELGVNPNDIPTHRKRGRCISKESKEVLLRTTMPSDKFAQLLEDGHVEEDQKAVRSYFAVDLEIPLFNEDRDYVYKM